MNDGYDIRYKDSELRKLEERSMRLLEKKGKVYNYELIDKFTDDDDNPVGFDWESKSTLTNALTELRNYLEDRGKITVEEQSGQGFTDRKVWCLNES